MKHFLIPGLALVTLLLPPAISAQPKDSTIAFEKCVLTVAGSVRTAEATCAEFQVPENPAAPDGTTITLKVALAAAGSKDPAADPLFLFAGGPGQAASEAYVQIRPLLEKIRRKRDIVLIDQRGTGSSNALRCAVDEAEELDSGLDLDKVRRFTADCLAGLNGDPRFYTTAIAMQDYDQVRAALGYEQINLLGISYGTRAAQVYMRHYPERVRSAILDSVVPMQLNLGEEHAIMLDRSVKQVLNECQATASCNDRFPDLHRTLYDLLARLRDEPRELVLTDPVTGEINALTVDAAFLAVAIRFLSYSSSSQAMLPLLIHHAGLDDAGLRRLASQTLLVIESLSEQISRGMEMSVICSEDFPFMTFDSEDQGTILGDSFLEVLKVQCGIWPRGEVSEQFHQPVASESPVLLLSGDRDPVTPPAYGDQALAGFSNALHLVAHGQGHNAIINQCIRGIVEQFILEPAIPALDTECVDNIAPAPFFTSLLGPDP